MQNSRLFLLAIGCSLLLLTACGTKVETPTNQNQNTNEETIISGDGTDVNASDLLSPNTVDPMACAAAVSAYLDAANLDGEGTKVIANGDKIVVDYIGRLDDGSVFDTSVEAVAKDCWAYSAGRDYSAGLDFEVGAGQMIAGFDAGVVGMKVWQTKTVNIPAKDAYWEYSEENIMTYPLSDVPNPDDYEEGMKFYAYWNVPVKVLKKTDTEITLDFNHDLAGKDLIFDITIKEIK